MANFSIKKINKRLWIVDKTGKGVYSYPDFVRLISRDNLLPLVEAFDKNGYDIEAIMILESNPKYRPDYRKNERYETFNERSVS